MLYKTILTLCATIGFAVTGIAHTTQTPQLTRPDNVRTTAQSVALDRIVAVVNNQIITKNQLTQAMQLAKAQYAQQHLHIPNDKRLQKQILNQLIARQLQLQIAKRNNISVSKTEITDAVKRIANNNKISVPELKQKLQSDNMSYDKFVKQLKEQILLSKLQRQVIPSHETQVTQKAINLFRDQHRNQLVQKQYHLVTILLPLTENSSRMAIKSATTEAELIKKQLQSGVTIDSEIQSHPGSADLGFRSLNDIPQIFAKRVQEMKVGQVVGPIRAPNGIHIIKLLDIKKESKSVTDDQIQQILFQQKMAAALEKWINNLKKSSYIKIYLQDS